MSRVTPSQTIGPFFHFALPFGGGERLVDPEARGAIRLEGRVLDGEGSPVGDAMIELWQADASGVYAHPEDPRHGEADGQFLGFGRTATDDEGAFSFVTLKPGRVPGRGNTLQAPHICVSIFARGLLDRVVTRIYFADEPDANDEDPVLGSIEDPARRATLLAQPANGESRTYRLDIRLQGDDETVFFDI